MAEKTLNHFTFFRFTRAFWALPEAERAAFYPNLAAELQNVAECAYTYQVFPTRADTDALLWCAQPAEGAAAAQVFFEKLAQVTTPYRSMIRPVDSLWGFTRPSQYTKARSAQEIDPFAETRMKYLVMYPFAKTAEWYLMSRESRQGMMNEHIRIGKQYEDIKQLLLYSFGLQDQEFVVVYETEDLPRFSDLVNELRDTEARRYTLQDTPVYTAIYHPAEETLALWK